MSLRESISGGPLPSARVVADKMVGGTNQVQSQDLSVHAMQWGQFLTHDLDHTPEVSPGPDNTWDCCGEHRDMQACAPIHIHGQDSIYGPANKTCINFVRSSLAPASGCRVDQQNQVTSYLDGSMIYGSDDNTLEKMRLYKGGLLVSSDDDNSGVLPPNSGGECHIPHHSAHHCFSSGDKRVNEQPGLALYHIIWHREHNRIARSLGQNNPYWDDEKIFQQARMIVTAQIQHITYNEYLPLILGPTNMATMKLLPCKERLNYNSSLDVSVSNAFATAALRFGHSMVPNNVMLSNAGCPRKTLMTQPLHSLFFNPELLHSPHQLTQCLAGLGHQHCPPPGPAFSPSLMGNLFINRDNNSMVGLDLVAINIQRGRDHGLPGYNSFRSLCGGKKVQHFSEFSDQMNSLQVKMLSQVYKHVDDVDLFLGGLMEKPLPGSLLGPTFSCIISDQMYRTMVGDRFFYSTLNQEDIFSDAQLVELKKTSLARVLCDNSGLLATQPLAFRTVTDRNPLVECSSSAIPGPNLHAWND